LNEIAPPGQLKRYVPFYLHAMKVRVETDDWTPDGRKILSAENLAIIRKTLEDEGPIIVEHWFYRGSRAPDRLIFDDFDLFVQHLQTNSAIGDAFHVWSYVSVCKNENEIASGKFPDDDGCVPRKGAY
jgi:hypothetical protein